MATRRPKPPRHSIPLLAEAQEHFHRQPVPDTPEQQLSWAQKIVAFLFKRASKHLSNHLVTRHGLRLTHGQSLDAVSASIGFADWNTANATINGMVESLAAAELGPSPASSTTAVTPGSGSVSLGVHQVHSTLKLDANRLLVGVAGAGKSFGLLLALQRHNWHRETRPVMAIHGYDQNSLHQPNWSGLARALEHSLTHAAVAQISMEPYATWASKDIVFVAPVVDYSADRHDRRMQVVEDCLSWLRANAHRKPVLLLDDVVSLLGPCAASLLEGVPAEVTIISAAQSMTDYAGIDLLARFDHLHLLRAPMHFSVDVQALQAAGFQLAIRGVLDANFVPLNKVPLADALDRLKQGQALELQRRAPTEAEAY